MLAGWKTDSNWWEERLAVTSLYTGVAQLYTGRHGTKHLRNKLRTGLITTLTLGALSSSFHFK